MPKLLITGAAGLHNAISDFVKPPNALNEASNIILRDSGVIEPRKGFIKQGSGYDITDPTGTNDWGTGRLFQYDNYLYLALFDKIYENSTGSWASVSTTVGTAIVGKTVPFVSSGVTYNIPHQTLVEHQQNLYVSSGNGLYMADTVGSQLYKAGFSTPAPIPNITATATAPVFNIGLGTAGVAGSFLWVDENNLAAAVAYRVVWGRKDAHDRIFYSEPSARTVQCKLGTAGQRFSVSGDVPAIPEGTSSTFYQVFRSYTVSRDQDASVPPSDNMYQVYEGMGANSFTGAIGSFSKAAGSSVVTVTKASHGYRNGMKVYFTFAAGDTDANELDTGLWTIAGVTTNTFTYNDSSANATGSPYLNAATVAVVPKFYPFNDQSPDNILFQPLYTNPLDGFDPQPNVQPPAACDIALWKNRMWFANTNGLHAYTITLVGINDATITPNGPTDGLAINDTITLNGMAFVAVASPTAGSLQFLCSKGDTSAANIDKTARSLVNTINNYTGNTTIRAYYLPGDSDWPGKIRIERLNQNETSFAIAVNNASAWAPYIPNGSTSKNDAFSNRLYFSKLNNPEAVPALNYIDVGAGNRRIIRILPIKESLFVFKEDGVFVVTGDYPFRLDLLDSKSIAQSEGGLIAGESCVYGLFNSGICRVDSTGIKNLSAPIASDLRNLSTAATPAVSALDEVAGILLMKVRSSGFFTAPLTWFCYNIRTNAWTTWDFTRNSTDWGFDWGDVSAAYYLKTATSTKNILYIVYSGTVTPTVRSLAVQTNLREALNNNLNYIDGSFAESTSTLVTGWAYNEFVYGASRTITLNSVFSNSAAVTVGDIIYVGNKTTLGTDADAGDFFCLITAINSTTSYTVKNVSYYSNYYAWGSVANGATVKLLRSITSRVAYDVNSPGNSRHYRDVNYMFKDFILNNPESIIFTDQNSTEVNSDIIFVDTNTAGMRSKRILFPSGHQYANSVTVGFKNSEAGTYYQLLGVGMTYEDVSERSSK